MSHFSTIKTQLKDAESLIKALNNLGYPINQDENRKIRLLVPEYVSDFVEEFNSLMGESRI